MTKRFAANRVSNFMWAANNVRIAPILIISITITLCAAQPPSTPDDRFISRTTQANLAEVQMSAWAKEHALSDEVRQFAGKVLNDHTVLADELRGLASKQGSTPVTDLEAKDAAELDHMKFLEPNLLDREYMREVLKWHQKEVEAFKREIDNGKDAALRYWAYQTLPKIEAHIRLGEDTERAIGMEVADKIAQNNNQK